MRNEKEEKETQAFPNVGTTTGRVVLRPSRRGDDRRFSANERGKEVRGMRGGREDRAIGENKRARFDTYLRICTYDEKERD